MRLKKVVAETKKERGITFYSLGNAMGVLFFFHHVFYQGFSTVLSVSINANEEDKSSGKELHYTQLP